MSMTQSEAVSREAARGQETLLRTEGLTLRFGGITALREIDVEVSVAEIVGVIGPNGAGKTTLFDSIAGMIRPSEGRIWLDGREITRDPAHRRARAGIRRTFQRQQPIGWLSVEDNALAALEWRGGGGGFWADLLGLPSRRRIERARREQVMGALEVCGLVGEARRPAAELSIGQARRMELARAIVDRPRLLLLDEPTSGLEEAEVEIFAATIEALRAATGCSILLVEHDVPFVMSASDRVLVMQEGRVIGSGTPAEVAADPVVRAAYLGA
ncbi:ABC transporter ATP-binding protein [Frankia nepalensis]|uniref:ABC transporter ATP-binding protein n=1 Tax=Frankia nepalensis TaxID=1836974 RepID=UPI001EE491C7|nr:ABC transporter ATP-binding protein [Frankia nepalensis]